MLKMIYSIKDLKLNQYMSPFFELNDTSAIRSLTSHMLMGESLLTQYPADFELFKLGEFDSSNGAISQNDATCIISCHSIHLSNLERAKQQSQLDKDTCNDKGREHAEGLEAKNTVVDNTPSTGEKNQ